MEHFYINMFVKPMFGVRSNKNKGGDSMAYELVVASQEKAYDSFKNREIGLYVYADYWELPSAMFFLIKKYEPGYLTPENYKEIVMKDYKDNYHECEELDERIGFPMSTMFLGYFDEEKDFINIQFRDESNSE